MMNQIQIIIVRNHACSQMSLYREAERQRRKLRRQQRKRSGKKSSLGAALSASLTALFTGGKDPTAAGYRSDCGGDYDYYYNTQSDGTSTERVEYVTVRGCHMACDDDDDGGNYDESPSCDGIRNDFDNASEDSAGYDGTKGLAQMAVTLGECPVDYTIYGSELCETQKVVKNMNRMFNTINALDHAHMLAFVRFSESITS